MKRSIRLLCFLYVLCCTVFVVAQPYAIQHLGVENGLSNNFVLSMAQDKRGCIWVATEVGLNRFDGNGFTVYKQHNSEIAGDALNTLLYDEKEDVLWMGGKFGGLCAWEGKSGCFRTYQARNGMKLENIVHLAKANDGGIWITPHHYDPIYFDSRSHRFTSLSDMGIQLDCRSNLCAFADGDLLYVGHYRGGMSIIDLKKKTTRRMLHDPSVPQSLPGHSVYSLYKDRLGHLWVGTEWGLGLLDSSTGRFTVFRHVPGRISSLVADRVYDICETADGKLWIACDVGGISILDLSQITFKHPEEVCFENLLSAVTGKGLSSSNIRKVLQDSYGNIWIGNYSCGLDFISHRPPVFQICGDRPVYGMYRGEEGQLWVGGENELLLYKNDSLAKRFDICCDMLCSYGWVAAIIDDGQGFLLLGPSDNGILRTELRTGKTERVPMGIRDVRVMTFFRDTDEKIWIGTVLGLYSYTKGIVRKETELNSKLEEKSVYGILRDRQGKLWVGTYGWGLKVFDDNNRVVAELNPDTGFPDGTVNSLFEDSQGGVWIATRAGLGYVPDTRYPERYSFYGYDHGLEDVFIRAVQEDVNGEIWISTNNGISHWDKKEQKFDNYDYRDGIPMGNFIEGSACRGVDGTLYFGSLKGICHFNPQELDTSYRVTPVQIMECRAMDGRTGKGDRLILPEENGNIELPYDRNSFRITFSVPDYAQNKRIEYAYKIEGLEDNWVNIGEESQMVLRNIPPGTYIFRVKARLRNGDWDESHVAAVPFCIHPPLWRTWYAYTFYGLLLLCGLYFWMCTYKRKLAARIALAAEEKRIRDEQELNNERLRFYTNVTHELRTPLTLILGPLEDLTGDGLLSEPYRRKVGLIYRNALQLLDLINRLLDFRKVETRNRRLKVTKGWLGKLVMEVGLRYKELNRNPKVDFRVEVPSEEGRMYFDSEVVTTILNNLLGNAMKYTAEGNIALRLQYGEEGGRPYAEIIVEDTGYGIAPHALPHIFERYYQAEGKHQASGSGLGLALVKSLADLHEGMLRVESELGRGSVFVFRLWADCTYPEALHMEGATEGTDKKTEDAVAEIDNRPLLLVVEDNDDIRDYVASSFDDEYHVVTAVNGKVGWEETQRLVPDIIISDIMMPEMDGVELCRKVKEDMRTSHIPVILLTAKDSIRDKEEGYESGADSYLTKPFSAKLLDSRVRNLLEMRKRLALQITGKTKELTHEAAQTGIHLNKLDEEFLRRFTEVVTEHINREKLDIPFMAAEMNMSVSTLYRKLKGLTGLSGNEFIRKIKLKHSLRLLTEQGLNVTEAAYASGFNDLGHFRRCFKEEYGVSPSKYAKQ